jgi:hypothetical protein
MTSTHEAWPFSEKYKEFVMPPTQVREALKRLAKKNVDFAAESDENLLVIKAVHQAYANKKERARAASSKARASKREVDDALAQDAAVCVPHDTNVSVCAAVECVAEPEACAPAAESAAAPSTAAAALVCEHKKKSAARADNIVVSSASAQSCDTKDSPTPVPKRPIEASTTRRGLCAMVASAAVPAL